MLPEIIHSVVEVSFIQRFLSRDLSYQIEVIGPSVFTELQHSSLNLIILNVFNENYLTRGPGLLLINFFLFLLSMQCIQGPIWQLNKH